MIQIEDLAISDFRGIRHLELMMKQRSYAVWGPNGTGKSGVVDAIDFLLTGKISRLEGGGSGNVTLLKHGPHVQRRDDPASAVVSAKVIDPTSGESAVLSRSVKDSKRFTLQPESPALRDAITRAGSHPELILSRRDVIKYIVATPGDRAAEVQALLKLDRLRSLRALFRAAKSKTASNAKSAQTSLESANSAMCRHLDIPDLRAEEVARVVNRSRASLSLRSLSSVDLATDLADGIDSDPGGTAFSRVSAIGDLATLEEAFVGDPPWAETFADLHTAIVEAEKTPRLTAILQSRQLLESGLDQLVDSRCPLCGVSWDSPDSLRSHLMRGLEESEEATIRKREVLEAASGCRSQIESVLTKIASVRSVAERVGAEDSVSLFDAWTTDLSRLKESLSNFDGILESRQQIALDPLGLPHNLSASVAELKEAIDKVPDQTAQAAARSFLAIANERWSALRSASLASRAANEAAESASALYTNYCSAQDEGLALLYQTVQERFGEFYRAVNADDESDFKASLEPSSQKLDLLVDFYGEGMFPPVAYHSEGHQDSMGVCLYLALMEKLLGDDFRLAVLDDVVMSVDASHRREFCNLLNTFSPDVQFVITTHDEVWARQMQKSGLVSKRNQVHFLRWTVEDGPVVMEGEDFWDRIAEDLNADNVSGAAARLRRNLESVLGELAEDLHGLVPYRTVGGPDLGELLGAVRKRYRDLLGYAADAANSWNNEPARLAASEAKSSLSSANLVQDSEQWAVNPAVHYNAWANFTKEDFVPVVEACRNFLALFRCDSCDATIHISRANGVDESLRCKCGVIQFDLRKK